MSAAWIVKDANGEPLAQFSGSSRRDVGRKLVGQRWDAFRLEVSASYRELFDQALARLLEHKGWEIVRVRS